MSVLNKILRKKDENPQNPTSQTTPLEEKQTLPQPPRKQKPNLIAVLADMIKKDNLLRGDEFFNILIDHPISKRDKFSKMVLSYAVNTTLNSPSEDIDAFIAEWREAIKELRNMRKWKKVFDKSIRSLKIPSHVKDEINAFAVKTFKRHENNAKHRLDFLGTQLIVAIRRILDFQGVNKSVKVV